jgi:hypothetical protein
MTSALLKYEASDVSDSEKRSIYITICFKFDINIFFTELELLLIFKLTDSLALTELKTLNFSCELDLVSKFDLEAINA